MTVRDESTCSRVAEAVQDILDGAAAALPPELEAHRQRCRDCQAVAAAAEQLRAGLAAWPRPAVSPDFAGRVVTGYLADRASTHATMRRWRRVVTWVTIAAAILLGAGIAVDQYWRSTRPMKVAAVSVPRAPARDQRPPGSLDLRENLASASDAILSLTRRTTTGTIAPTTDLLSLDMETSWLKPPDALPDAADPAAQSLEEVRQGAAAGFEPMANSARRAFAMFTRDLPTSKPGS